MEENKLYIFKGKTEAFLVSDKSFRSEYAPFFLWLREQGFSYAWHHGSYGCPWAYVNITRKQFAYGMPGVGFVCPIGNHAITIDEFMTIYRIYEKYQGIFAIAVVHMLVLDGDRDGFYRFIRSHLTAEGIALICTMGDGEFEMQSDISTAFTLQERNHDSGKMTVAGTSCRTVSWNTFEKELKRNALTIVEKGITSSLPDFNSLMYAVVKA